MASEKTKRRQQAIVSEPVIPQLTSLTIPMMAGILAIMGMGVIDSYFIGFLGTEPLAAISFVFPIIFIFNSIALGFGMAISSITSKLIGQQDTSQASKLVSLGISMSFITAVIISLLVGVNIDTLFTLAGADASTLPHIHSYMSVFVFAMPLMLLMTTVSSTYRAIGNTAMSANVAVGVTLINVVLSPLLIFGVGPFPRLEMAGAALASLLAIAIMTGYSTLTLVFRERLLTLSREILEGAKQTISQLLSIAIPAIFSNIISPLSASILTFMIAKYGNEAVAAFGVGSRIERIVMLVVYALSSTLPMFIGQNLGANRQDRVSEAIKVSFRFIIILQAAIWLLLILFAKPIAAQFSDSAEVQSLIELYLYILPLSYGVAGLVVLANVAMNVFSKPKTALLVNLVRLFLFYIPFAYVGGLLDQERGMFIAISIANVFVYLFSRHLFKNILLENKVPA